MGLFAFQKKGLSIFFTLGVLFTASTGQTQLTSSPSQNETHILKQYQRVQKILDQRCTVCHACTESPCQLNLTSAQHIRRGISKGLALETRLFPTEKKWPDTQKNFTSVLPEKSGEGSLFRDVLAMGSNALSSNSLSTARRMLKEELLICPQNSSEYHAFIKKMGPIGMPLGLPSLPENEFKILNQWLENGAPLPSNQTLALLKKSKEQKQAVQEWEDFFNHPAPERRLVARYIFEHMSLSHLVLNNHPSEFFELVRSENQYGFPIKDLRLNRTNSEPRKKSFFYRLSRITSAPLRKTHLVWDLNTDSKRRFETLFFETPWKLPASYKDSYSGNPFVDFAAIPAKARAQFMIENSQQIIDQMVRGPVCVGPVATYAIRDHFWVMFLKPEKDPSVLHPDLQKNEWGLPGPIQTELGKISDYQDEWMITQRRLFPDGLEQNQIWQGHPNSQLTIFRHSQNSSVHQGFIGGGSPTAWILSYSNFERLYYNLVVNFEPRSSSFSMLDTWQTMREIRQEGEELFLLLLPESLRDEVRHQWNSQNVAYQALRLHKLRGMNYSPSSFIDSPQDPVREAIRPLFMIQGEAGPAVPNSAIQYLPELSYVVITKNKSIVDIQSLIRHRWFSNHLFPFQKEENYHLKNHDQLSWLPGAYGSHPSMFFYVEQSQLPKFTEELRGLDSEETQKAFLNKWGLRREHQNFWTSLDLLTSWMKKNLGHNGGLLDLGQYDL